MGLGRFGAVVIAVATLVSCGGSGTPDTTSPPAESTPTSSAAASSSSPPTTGETDPSTTVATTTPGDPDDPWAIEFPSPDRPGALLGFSTELSAERRPARWAMLEADAGRQYDIAHVFHAWDLAIPTADDLMHIEDGRLLMISWNGTDTREIASGVHDDWIRSQARGVRDLDRRVLLRWLWEMDGNRRRAWVHSGPDYVAAWNHIRRIFDEEGALNAEWVWCPNEFLFWDGGDPEPWYPGDDAVDWLCADGYNWATSSTSDEWVDFADIFGDFYRWAEPRGKPIVIGETGSGEAEPGAKAEWIRSIPEILERDMPEIDAVVYFDKDFRRRGHRDWRLDTSESAYAAWLEISNDPWFDPLGR